MSALASRARLRFALTLLLLLPFAASVSAATHTVTNTNDSGPGSLRAAIEAANGDGGTIVFAIGSGSQSIRPQTALPRMHNGVVLDGRTQPGFTGAPLIEIDCSLLTSTFAACMQASDGAAVLNLVINRSPGVGMWLERSARLYGSYIGTDVSGQLRRPNNVGVHVDGEGIVGGPEPGQGNLISANSMGVRVQFGGGTIAGNRIGTDVSGTRLFANTTGIHAHGGNVTVGGDHPQHGNVIVGGTQGILITSSDGPIVRNNSIGVAGTVRFPMQYGISVSATSNAAITENTITGSTIAAVQVTGIGLRNSIRRNSIYENNFAIDLGNSGFPSVTQNDNDDADTGPNNLQNFPVLTSVESTSNSTRVIGTLRSTRNDSFTIDLYSNPSCSRHNHGEGRTHVGAFQVTTDASGLATFDQTIPTGLPSGTIVTSTATSALEGTSEFSACHAAHGAGVFAIGFVGYNVREGGTASLTVRRDFGAIGTATVDYWTTPETASSADFVGTSGTLTFADGETSKAISIATVNDAEDEPFEQFKVSIGNPTGGAVIASNSSSAMVLIEDDDPAPRVLISNITVVEGNTGTTPAQFTLTLTQQLSRPVMITYATSPGSARDGDYLHMEGTVTFLPGETVKTITVNVFGDPMFEPDEYFRLIAFGGGIGVVPGTCTIRNDDTTPTISLEDVEVLETGTSLAVTLTFTAPYAIRGYVHYYLVDGTARSVSDYAASAGLAFFRDTSTASAHIIIQGDDKPEPDEHFYVEMWESSFPLTRRRATITILNDDAGVGPEQQRVPVGQSATFLIDFGRPATAAGEIALRTSGTGFAVPNSVTIHPGSSRVSFDARAVSEGTASIDVIMPAALGGKTHTVTASSYIARKVVFTPNELALYVGQTMPVTASLSPASDQPVTVTLDAKTDAATLPASITIPAGGSTTFEIKAVKEGAVVVHTSINGDDATGLFGHVSTTPVTPAILRVSPVTGTTAGGTALDVTGVHFRSDCTVSFGGMPGAVRYVSSTHLVVTTPPHDAGTVDVELLCGEHVWIFSNGFTFAAASPEITSVVPAFGNIAGGTEVRISGQNFRSSCWPSFGGTPAPRSVVEGPTAIAATAPPHAAGSVAVSLRCTGNEAMRADAFHYNTSPEPVAAIESISPMAGAPGQPVTITGLRFRATDRILFGQVEAAILGTRSGQHVVRVPELPLGKTAITLSDANGHVTTTGPIFNVLEAVPPLITTVAPTSAPAGAELRVDGRGFRPGYLFRIGGKIAGVASMQYATLILRIDPTVAPGEHDIEIYNASGNLAGIGPRVRVVAKGVAIHAIDINCATTDGGLTANITGSGFANGAIVRFNSVIATDVMVVDDKTIRVVVPPGEAGPVVISVANADGTHARLTGRFRLTSPFDPNGGCATGGRSRSVRH